MTLDALNEGVDVIIMRHGGCEGEKERKKENENLKWTRRDGHMTQT